MSTDPKTVEQHENKHDSDGNTKHILQSSPPTKQTSGEESGSSSSKKNSKWKKVRQQLRSTAYLLSKDPKTKAPASAPPDAASAPPPSQPPSSDQLIKRIAADLFHIYEETKNLQQHNNFLITERKKFDSLFEEFKSFEEDEKVKRLNELRKKLMKVKLAIPKYKKREEDKNLGFINEERSIYGDDVAKKMPQLHRSPVFETSLELRDFEARYMELDDHVKLCLLCFSIFPQDAVVKKRLMLQWWVVEGFATTEKDAADHFKKLMEKGFIHPVNDNRSPSVGSCRVHPFHRSALVALAERARLFNFSGEGDPTQSFSGCLQACLMGAGLISYEDFQEKKKSKNGEDQRKVINDLIQELEKLHLLMNVDEHILEFIDEWFSKLENLNFLYLGRWKASATHHIEVEDPKFLEKLWNMKYLKFLSLQGISNIISLPASIKKLTNLDVLDLRACSNLESIPKDIGSHLQMLTHLDMSECYLLAHMPKSLKHLKKLKVLKGFFIPKVKSPEDKSPSCTLGDLKELEKLEKLCIYTDGQEFPEETHVEDLEKLTSLAKLTITWGVSHNKSKEKEQPPAKEKPPPPPPPPPQPQPPAKEKPPPPPPQPQPPAAPKGRLPRKLKKLDLKCFPKSTTPYWLELKNLKELTGLNKLYIRGGQLTDLGQYQGIDDKDDDKWMVQVLRLKYLSNIKMEWRQLQKLFPKLEYLEKVSCPNLTLFPCDAKGVWMKPHQISSRSSTFIDSLSLSQI